MAESGKIPAVILPLHYLPNLTYFCCILQAERVVIETKEHFQKQTLRNRCYVNTANGVEVMSVPLLKPTNRVPVDQVRIDYGQQWVIKHWRCLTSAYANSPFFEYYAPDFLQVLESKPPGLYELNHKILTLCLRFLRLQPDLTYNLSYEKVVEYPVFDARSCITDKKNVNRYQFYRPIPYYQTFGNDFSNNLSIVDLLFNTGPEASEILQKSTVFQQTVH